MDKTQPNQQSQPEKKKDQDRSGTSKQPPQQGGRRDRSNDRTSQNRGRQDQDTDRSSSSIYRSPEADSEDE